ncbi:hypothetical protein QH494_16100 [Sphingomonas sp. AR_OL41]|uniref:hypothetical protein n=1 Tax=Sphingomonas sp. AR_OL41 TaxID=3042729 RepID=UPI00248105EE|nr:hypothetical protein [Sphingomonas sp. AR_OL41]MDH7973715.1 hypothetical protein [Sphingomonas sp. AR_OL41]
MTATAQRRLSASQLADMVRRGPRLAPSDPRLWVGTTVIGSSWTREQLAVLEEEGRDPHRIPRFPVLMQRPSPHGWTMPPEQFLRDMPELARTRDRLSVLIVTPSGDKVWRKVR